MKQQDPKIPKIFISYSWTTPEHENWVLNLATRLRNDFGIDVILDKWDLKAGNDTFAFMEVMAENDIDKVLIICDKGYAERADARKGGVGVEAQIITPEIYSDMSQVKFIPIIAERDDLGNDYLPVFLKSKLYFDLSNSNKFEHVLEDLVRDIWSAPTHKKPALGKVPLYLFEEDHILFTTGTYVRKMQQCLDNNSSRLKYFWFEFKDAFIESLGFLEFKPSIDYKYIDEDYCDSVVTVIRDSELLRKDFSAAVDCLCQTEKDFSNELIEFFESCYKFTEKDAKGNSSKGHVEPFKFLLNEIVLLTIGKFMRIGNYDTLSSIVNATYNVKTSYGEPRKNITEFRFLFECLRENREKRETYVADLMISRCKENDLHDFIEADSLLYYITKLNPTFQYPWFPITYMKLNEERHPIKALSRLVSEKYFNQIEDLFGLSKESFKQAILDFKQDRGYRGCYPFHIPSLDTFITIDEFCSRP